MWEANLLSRWVIITASTLLAGQGMAQAPAVNLAKYRMATGLATGDFVVDFVTDGKLGPENQWVTDNRGPRLNLFFETPVTVDTIRIFTTDGYGDDILEDFQLQVLNANLQFVPVTGASISGNTAREIEVTFPPVTGSQFQLLSGSRVASVLEVVMFSSVDVGTPPIHAGIEPHMARQHRVAMTYAPTTEAGTRRRSVVDGFVSDSEYWKSNSGSGSKSIELDLRDPPETDPPRVRTVTSPVEIGSVHLYSGLDSGAEPPIGRGRVQTWDETTMSWVTVPGSPFSGNTSPELDIVFDAPVVASYLRLLIEDGADRVIREIVPLPPRDNNASWPFGAGVRDGVRPAFVEFDDRFCAMSLSGSSLVVAEGGELKNESGNRDEHYQVLLKVNTDEYWIRNRESGLGLAPSGMGMAAGTSVVEEPYAALPHQHWRMEDIGGSVRFINAYTGLALVADAAIDGSGLSQQPAGAGNELWNISERDTNDKKGHGGYPQLADDTKPTWAYNWGQDDGFPVDVDFWPMQWGTFNWMGHYRAPLWQRRDEPFIYMGFNEPDGAEQSDIPVDIAVAMWPRLEARDMPLLAPAPVGATNQWITDFEAGAQAEELRIDFQPIHWYANPNADNFINNINNTYNVYGRRVAITEFSCVDWNNNNNFNKDEVYHFFLEVFWRMENLDILRQFAVFMFQEDPSSSISDNRGETVDINGDLTPLGELLAAWDGDTTIRPDTPYYIQNRKVFRRLGLNGAAATPIVGDRFDTIADYQWTLVPSGQVDRYNLLADDGRILHFDSTTAASLVDSANAGSPGTEFELSESSHGWFYIDEVSTSGRLRVSDGLAIEGVTQTGFTGQNVQFRFVPVFNGAPGPVRNLSGTSLGGGSGQVELTWDTHGFRDIEGFEIHRAGPSGGAMQLIASGVEGTSFIDQVPAVGTYSYCVIAIGDTGPSDATNLPAIAVDTCPADFNADFTVGSSDVLAVIGEVELGLDFDGSGDANMFDLISYLGVFDSGCE